MIYKKLTLLALCLGIVFVPLSKIYGFEYGPASDCNRCGCAYEEVISGPILTSSIVIGIGLATLIAIAVSPTGNHGHHIHSHPHSH